MPRRPDTHRPARAAAQEEHQTPRASAAARGYDRRWRKARENYLREHPLCVACKAEGKIVSATVVDHIKPHRGDQLLMWDQSNWQPLCARHHAIKTARDDGGFGNRISDPLPHRTGGGGCDS
jgi:5-methylcytosine-specific restriction protein A